MLCHSVLCYAMYTRAMLLHAMPCNTTNRAVWDITSAVLRHTIRTTSLPTTNHTYLYSSTSTSHSSRGTIYVYIVSHIRCLVSGIHYQYVRGAQCKRIPGINTTCRAFCSPAATVDVLMYRSKPDVPSPAFTTKKNDLRVSHRYVRCDMWDGPNWLTLSLASCVINRSLPSSDYCIRTTDFSTT